MTEYKGKWAIITGAAHGIGRALANKCVCFGINVVLIDIDEKSLLELKSQILSKYPSVCALAYNCDISNAQGVKAMVNKFKNDYRSFYGSTSNNIIVHFLFNNAGVSSFTNILNGDLKRMHKTMNINLWGTIYITQSFLPFLQTISKDISYNNDDRFIINTASVAGIATADSFYAVTKHGVCALTEVFECELRKYNKKCKKEQNGKGIINVSCLIPSYVKSSFFESVGKVHEIENVWEELQKTKTYNSGRPHPEMWKANGIDPSIVADVVFLQGIKQKNYWIHTHEDWSKCSAIDRFYSIYTQKFNQYEATRKVFNKYKENLKNIIRDKKSKL
eukprot:322659_1